MFSYVERSNIRLVMSKVIYPGSFDPVTLGHIDIIQRASKVFDEVIVCILNNLSKKSSLFSIDVRANMLKESVKDLPNVTIDSYEGLLVDYAAQKDVNILIRGVREEADFSSEFKMAQGNRSVAPFLETLFIPTDPEFSFVSSSMAKEFASFGADISAFVPDHVAELMLEKLYNNK